MCSRRTASDATTLSWCGHSVLAVLVLVTLIGSGSWGCDSDPTPALSSDLEAGETVGDDRVSVVQPDDHTVVVDVGPSFFEYLLVGIAAAAFAAGLTGSGSGTLGGVAIAALCLLLSLLGPDEPRMTVDLEAGEVRVVERPLLFFTSTRSYDLADVERFDATAEDVWIPPETVEEEDGTVTEYEGYWETEASLTLERVEREPVALTVITGDGMGGTMEAIASYLNRRIGASSDVE